MASKRLRKLGARAAGAALLGVGTALLVLPGPGIPLIIAGVALLTRESPWAARLLERGKATWRRRARR